MDADRCDAHNLARWAQLIALEDEVSPAPRTIATFRRRMIALPGRITRSGPRQTLHLHARWPWQRQFVEALEKVRALPAAV